MNTSNIKITMSIVLASMLSMGMTGCGSSSDTSGTDVTVERGKVYDATVKDSSTPAQVASQKSGQNVYTFAKAPTYPVVVNGGWIDVNDDGKQGTEDVALDIPMKSYTTTVTPITTYVADANETIREQKLEALVAKLNEAGVGEDTNVTVDDLLKVPSAAPKDVMITANAIYKDMKENNNSLPNLDAIGTQFSTIESYATGSDASAYEAAVIQNLANQSLIAKFTQEYIDSLTPVVVTPPTSGTTGGATGGVTGGATGGTTGGATGGTTGGATGGATLPDLGSYSSIIIYKNINQTFANGYLNAYSSNPGFDSSNTSASCTDFGFTANDLQSTANGGGVVIKTYSIINTTTARTCIESNYTGTISAGNANVLAYYGN